MKSGLENKAFGNHTLSLKIWVCRFGQSRNLRLQYSLAGALTFRTPFGRMTPWLYFCTFANTCIIIHLKSHTFSSSIWLTLTFRRKYDEVRDIGSNAMFDGSLRVIIVLWLACPCAFASFKSTSSQTGEKKACRISGHGFSLRCWVSSVLSPTLFLPYQRLVGPTSRLTIPRPLHFISYPYKHLFHLLILFAFLDTEVRAQLLNMCLSWNPMDIAITSRVHPWHF